MILRIFERDDLFDPLDAADRPGLAHLDGDNATIAVAGEHLDAVRREERHEVGRLGQHRCDLGSWSIKDRLGEGSDASGGRKGARHDGAGLFGGQRHRGSAERPQTQNEGEQCPSAWWHHVGDGTSTAPAWSTANEGLAMPSVVPILRSNLEDRT